MAEFLDPAEEQLLSWEDPPAAPDPKRYTAARGVVTWVLDMGIALIFLAWVALVFVFPLNPIGELLDKVFTMFSKSIYGLTGGYFLVFSGPILVVTLLAIARLIISGAEDEELLLKIKRSKHSRISLWTFPVMANGILGVVSAAEFIGSCVVIAYVIWALSFYTLEDDVGMISQFTLSPIFTSDSELILELSGLWLGFTGLFCFAFLFLPITRGSALLRLVDIPFEQAARYHVWLGHLTMLLFTLHGLCFVIAWTMQGILLQEITSWSDFDIAVLPGVVSLLSGLLLWITSLPPVRRKQFELFFYTHHLYVVFVVFFAMHIGDFIFSIAAGGILLFIIDRFLRFCQSRRTVNVISATSFPCGTVELVLPKPGNLQYNALSFIFLQVRELSWLQWHPFSVSSSPLDGKNHLSVLVKVLGGWTAKLNKKILNISETCRGDEVAFQCPDIKASVEGPYGHRLPYHLMYENLILVAGGIGISPFLAILSDVLHRINEGKLCLPRNVLLIWAIKQSDELPLLPALDIDSTSPYSPSRLKLDINIYVTRESEPPLEEGNTEESYVSSSNLAGCGMSVVVSTGNLIWFGLYTLASVVGFIVSITLLDIFYVNPFELTMSYKGFLFVVCMLASVIVFGGTVVLLWYCWEKRTTATEKSEQSKMNLSRATVFQGDMPRRQSVGTKRVFYGSRPNLKEIFGSVSEQQGHVDIGVIVCGPTSLEITVAKECRSWNLKRGSDLPVFHFNSHTFNL
ncbi:hypothetical protein SAY87_001288 [Trapa incisa]|uniref:FAD-binding FR-type domain-containing protein n=1 Tax=Trapa incisa TaxID=236973 RepID=A0AAN7JH86_9MYRT|nr:hypothetical protein SAY87_001288 [Trapa incisa]